MRALLGRGRFPPMFFSTARGAQPTGSAAPAQGAALRAAPKYQPQQRGPPGARANGGSRARPPASGGSHGAAPRAGGTTRMEVAPAFMELQGRSVQQLAGDLATMEHATLMEHVRHCPYGRLMASNAAVQDLVRSFILALVIHLEDLVGRAPPHARLPSAFTFTDCDSVLNLFKQNRALSRPSLPLMSALLAGGFDARYPPLVQRSLSSALALGVLCPSLAQSMEQREVREFSAKATHAVDVGPKGLRNLLQLCKSMHLGSMVEAVAAAFLQIARDKQYKWFWRQFRSPERSPNPNLFAALFSDMCMAGASTGTMREAISAMGRRVLLGEGRGKELSVAGHALLLRTLVSLALDEGSVTREETEAHPERALAAYLTAARPLFLLAIEGINAHYLATPPGFFERMVGAIGSYSARSDAMLDAKQGKNYEATMALEPGDGASLLRWMRNVPPDASQALEVHKLSIDLAVLATASALLETLLTMPGAAEPLQRLPTILPGIMHPILTALGKSRAAEGEAHAALLTPRDAAAAASAASSAAAAAATAAAAAAAANVHQQDYSSSLSYMQQLVTLRVHAVLLQVASLCAAGAGDVQGHAISGVALTPAQLQALHSLGLPSLAIKVMDYSLDLAWPRAHLGLEIDGPLHFEQLSAAEMSGALDAVASDESSELSVFSAPASAGLPTVFDWSVPMTRYAVVKVGLTGRAKGGSQGPGKRLFSERVRLQALALRGWSLAHVDYAQMEGQMPILVKLLRFGAERDPVELARRAQLLELSVADIARTAAGGEFPGIPHMNSAHVVQAVTEMDAIILKALLGRMEGLKPAAAPAL